MKWWQRHCWAVDKVFKHTDSVAKLAPQANFDENPQETKNSSNAVARRRSSQKADPLNCAKLKETNRLEIKRYWVLFLFSGVSLLNSLQFTVYSIISRSVECYYDVDAYAVNWTSSVFYVVYLLLVIPISWLIDKFSLKTNVMLLCSFNCLCTISRCFTLSPSGYPLIMYSQTFAAIGNVFMLVIPTKLSAVWFGEDEWCRATAIGLVGNQLGEAIGCLVPSLLVTNDCSQLEVIGKGFEDITYGAMAVNVFAFLLVLATFQSKPSAPANDVDRSEEVNTNYIKSISNLMKSVNFHWLLLSFGLVIAFVMAFASLLDQMLAKQNKVAGQPIGWIGVAHILFGMLGVLASGYALDRTHKFKAISLTYCIGGILSMALFTSLITYSSEIMHYISASLLGFFIRGFYPIGYEYAVEIAYPEPEGLVTGILNLSTMIYGLILTFVGSYMLQTFGILVCCLFFCGILVLATVCCGFIKPKLKRTEKSIDNKCYSENQSSDRDSQEFDSWI